MIQHWKGLRILNTRPLGQNQALSQAIRAVGAIPIECPVLSIQPVEEDWTGELGDLKDFHHAIFISVNAVQYCFKRLQELTLAWPASIRVIAVGQSTAAALAANQIRVDDVPVLSSSEGILALDAMQHVRDQKILLVKGEGGRELLTQTLTMRGGVLVPVEVYRRTLPVYSKEYIQSLWRDDAVDAIVFTSEESMHNAFKLFGKEAHAWLQNKPCLVKSPRLARVAADLGMKKIIENTDLYLRV